MSQSLDRPLESPRRQRGPATGTTSTSGPPLHTPTTGASVSSGDGQGGGGGSSGGVGGGAHYGGRFGPNTFQREGPSSYDANNGGGAQQQQNSYGHGQSYVPRGGQRGGPRGGGGRFTNTGREYRGRGGSVGRGRGRGDGGRRDMGQQQLEGGAGAGGGGGAGQYPFTYAPRGGGRDGRVPARGGRGGRPFQARGPHYAGRPQIGIQSNGEHEHGNVTPTTTSNRFSQDSHSQSTINNNNNSNNNNSNSYQTNTNRPMVSSEEFNNSSSNNAGYAQDSSYNGDAHAHRQPSLDGQNRSVDFNRMPSTEMQNDYTDRSINQDRRDQSGTSENRSYMDGSGDLNRGTSEGTEICCLRTISDETPTSMIPLSGLITSKM
ncbi:hypothetical protein MHU86_13391 [Fragilaria crotonensis]|nr:hypothetical protein MHU86_13391 [Fragilaria crotonensis]